jgi:NAD(P)H-flavin reductase
MVPVPHRVADKRQETHDTWTLLLEPSRESIAPFSPGQFAMLYAFGVGEIPVSFSGESEDGGRLRHTVRSVGATSGAICSLEKGAYVGVRGPFGSSWPVTEAEGRDVIVVAGGIGLAPLRPVIYHVLSHRERFARVTIAYGARAPAELLYMEELQHWRARLDVELGVTVDSAGAEWRGRVGVVTTLIGAGQFDAANATAFVCGPEVMMRFTIAALRDAQLPDASIRVSMERSMKCAVGHCGRCQLRERFVCKDGPVFRGDEIGALMRVREL